MVYSEFVKKIAKENNLPITKTKEILKYLVEQLRESVNNNGKLRIYDFGSFRTSLHSEKIMHSPDGNEHFIPPSFSILFKLNKKHEKLLNNK